MYKLPMICIVQHINYILLPEAKGQILIDCSYIYSGCALCKVHESDSMLMQHAETKYNVQ